MLVLLACTGKDPAAEETPPAPRLVPAPDVLTQEEGSYTLDESSGITGMDDEAALLRAALSSTGLPLEGADIVLATDDELAPGAYELDIDDGVRIVGGDAAGVFWGTQTLRQLLPPETLGASTDVAPVLPRVHIEDAPRFAWRGYMLDVARHFFTKEEVERQIDLMALHKLSVLHMHLTDDQGWRIEIEGWPELTEIGGATEVGGGEGGWYTAEDWAEIVAYGAARHITVVPEIDFPGHSNAAVASVAALNESGEPADVYTGEGVISTPLWLEGPDTWDFVADVWTAMAEMTPTDEVHIGGDEAVDIDAVSYADFLLDLQDHVESQGKGLIGWDEVATAGLTPPYTAQYWWDDGNAQMAWKAGAGVIISPAEHCYLDMEIGRAHV